MFQYLTVIWNEHDRDQCQAMRQLNATIVARKPSLTRALLSNGVAVYFDPDIDPAARTYLSREERGIVIGRIFGRGEYGSEGPHRPLDDSFFEAMSCTDALADYWGRYVAFARDPRTHEVLVLPDPTGECPCYVCEYQGMTLLAGCVSTLAAIDLLEFSIDWDYVRAQLIDPTQQLRNTGLMQLKQLRAGETLRVSPDGSRRYALGWNLFELAARDPIDDFNAAVECARQTVQSCISAWASCYPRIIHMLSGGLDSSIVLACLLRAPVQADVTCLNVYDPTVGGDERRFARLATEQIRSTDGRRSALMEYPREVDAVRLDTLSHIRLSACPASYLPNAAYRHLHRQAVGKAQGSLTTGLGGDYIFYRTSSARPAVDYVHDHGLGRDLPRIVRESTGYRTYWTVLREALAVGWLGRPLAAPATSLDSGLLHPDLILSAQTRTGTAADWPPDACRTVAPNKRRQLQALYRPVRKHDPFDEPDRLHWVAPLLSQPIMETFARVPVYVLKMGGIDRAVARRAFASELPRALLERRSKGVTNHFIHRVFVRHQDYFRSVFLEGVLARQGLLNRPRIESFFSAAQDGFTEGFSTLLGTCLDLELWLQRWEQHSRATVTTRRAG